jgi:hypothetical protein
MVKPEALGRILLPYSTETVALPFYSLVVTPGIANDPDFYLIDFRLDGATAAALHVRLNKSTFRLVDVGPQGVSDFDSLTAVFDRAKAFVEALKGLGIEEGD